MANLDFNEDLQKAVPFRFERHLNDDRYLAFFNWIASQLYEPAQIAALRPGSHDQLVRTISCLVANLVHAAFAVDRRCLLSISLREGTFRRSRYNRSGIGHERFREVVDLMEHAHAPLLDLWIGFQDRARRIRRPSKLRATQRLLHAFAGYSVRLRGGGLGAAVNMNELMNEVEAAPMAQNFRLSGSEMVDDVTEAIILRDAEKKNTPYDDTDLIVEMRQRLESWNRFTADNFHLDIIISDDQLRNMFADRPLRHAAIEANHPEIENDEEDDEQPEEFFNRNQRKTHFLDLTKTRLHRVFNNGAFEEGGRFYGGWWISVPKEFRPYITINNVPTAEYDFHIASGNALRSSRRTPTSRALRYRWRRPTVS